MTAKQKWKQYDSDTYTNRWHGIWDTAELSREAYKSVLRGEIEKSFPDGIIVTDKSLIRETMLKLLDTVEPRQNEPPN